MGKAQFKKISPILLALILLLQVMSVSAFAEDGETAPTEGNTPPVAASIELSASPTELVPGTSATVTALVADAEGTPLPDTAPTWTLEGNLATDTAVSGDGLIATVNIGAEQTEAFIVKASLGDVVGTISLSVPVAPSPESYAITYHAGGGSGEQSPETAIEGEEFTLPEQTTFIAPSGMNFLGWALTEGGDLLGSTQIFTQPTLLYAVWGLAPQPETLNHSPSPLSGNTITVTYVVTEGNGQAGPTQHTVGEIFYGTYLSSGSPPQGKDLVGWSLTEGGPPLSNSYILIDNITVYSIWGDTVTLTYHLNDGVELVSGVTIQTQPVLANQPISLAGLFPAFGAPSGKSFLGWSTTQDKSGLLSGTHSFANDTDLYAIFDDTITVTFDPNGGTGTAVEESQAKGTTFILYDVSYYNISPENESLTFIGWSYEPNGTPLTTGQHILFHESDTLYAIWKEAVTISFDANGGTGTLEPVKAGKGEYTAIPFAPFSGSDFAAPDGKLFLGWSTTRDESDLINTSYFQNSLTLYAIWSDIVTITFDSNGGGGYENPLVYAKGNAVALPFQSTFSPPEDKMFAGWSLTKDGAALPSLPTPKFETDTILYAVWADTVTFSFHANGGGGSQEALTVAMGSSVYLPYENSYYTEFTLTPPNPDQGFVGWATSQNGAPLGNNSAFIASTNQSFYAIWADAYTISYDATEGFGNLPNNTAYAGYPVNLFSFSSSHSLTPPVGKVFAGWSLTRDGELLPTEYTFTQDETLYAVWRAQVTITVDLNGGTGQVPAFKATEGIPYSIQNLIYWHNITAPEGKEFGGWSLTRNGTPLPRGNPYTFTQSTTIYAVWAESSTILLSFDANGGTGTQASYRVSKSYLFNSATSFPGNESGGHTLTISPPDGKSFVGWSLEPNGSPLPSTIRFSEDTTLYALWGTPITLTFDLNGGSGTLPSETMISGLTHYLPTNVPGISGPDGLLHSGWSLTRSGGPLLLRNVPYRFYEDTTLYAQWGNVYNVTFDANGGSGSQEAAQAAQSPSFALPTTTTFTAPEGKVFLGWALTNDGSILGNDYAFTQNTTLYAQWGTPSENTSTPYIATGEIDVDNSSTPPGTYLSIQEAPESKVAKFTNFAQENGLSGSLSYISDIVLLNEDGTPAEPDANTRIRINVPGLTPQDSVRILHEKANGDIEIIPASSHDGYLVFTPNGFSVYGVVVQKNASTSSGASSNGSTVNAMLSPQTGVRTAS